MEIGRIQGAQRVVGKSQGYYGVPIRDEAKQLGDLPHLLHTMGFNPVDGECPTMNVVFYPTPDEIAKIAAGAPIYLSIVGVAFQPMNLTVGEVPE